MNADERSNFAFRMETELLIGGVMLSEWTTFLAGDADEAFVAGADLAALLVAQAAIESHLRYEYFQDESHRKVPLWKLIDEAPLPDDLKADLHTIRKFRNRWVHVESPEEDQLLL